MGNLHTRNALDANYEFVEVCSQCETMPYPSNIEFQRRVSASEWNILATDFNRLQTRFLYRIIIPFFLLIIMFILGAAVSPFFFLAWILLFPVVYVTIVFRSVNLGNLIGSYNNALFKPRGCKLKYFSDGEHRSSCIRGKMAYPATPAAADLLSFPSGRLSGNENARNTDIETQFAEANQLFAASAVATSMGPTPQGTAGNVNINAYAPGAIAPVIPVGYIQVQVQEAGSY